MSEAPTNKQPVNQAALRWLEEGKMEPDGDISYLVQLASWGFEKDVVNVPRPIAPSQPERADIEQAVNKLLKRGPKTVAFATEWFLSNPNLTKEEQAQNLVWQLEQAPNPSEAAQAVVETVYDLMVAVSETSPE
jgi:dTDP-glucose pyrophosphorylase